MNHFKMLARLLCLLGLLSLNACSKVKTIYGLADWAIEKGMEDFIKPNASQAVLIRAEVKDYMRQHQRELLPVYAAAAEGIAKDLRLGVVDDASYNRHTAAIEDMLNATLLAGVPGMARILGSLDAAQVEAIITKMEERRPKNEKPSEIKTEAQIAEQTIEERVRRTKKFMEFFVGDLDRGQREELRAAIEAYPIDMSRWKRQQEEREANFKALLRKQPGAGGWETEMKKWLTGGRVWSGRDPSRPGDMDPDAARRHSQRLQRMLTFAQRNAGAEKLEGYAREFRELAAEAQLVPQPKPTANVTPAGR